MIGIFDSGFGGLSVLREVRALLPGHNICYLADTAYCPYGGRAEDDVRGRSLVCARWLADQGIRLLVVACNTASAAALEAIRATLPLPVVGMEPGIKPAIAASKRGVVGVLATGGTLASRRFAGLVDRYAHTATVITVPCPGLVECVEAGNLDGSQPRALLSGYLATLHEADALVLGCTHYPFLRPLISDLAGPNVCLIDTGPAVARRVAALAAEYALAPDQGFLRYATTGDPHSFATVRSHLLPTMPAEVVFAPV
jgi:glutamate racemase